MKTPDMPRRSFRSAIPTAFFVCAPAFLTIGLPGFAWSQTAAESQALIKQYCQGCHNSKLKSASLSLEGLDLSKVSDDAGLWEKVLRKVEAKQMPPLGLPHPAPAAQKAFTTYLETELDRAAAAHPNPGHTTVH